MRTTRRATIPMLCLLALGPGLTGCDDQPAVCDDLDALSASVDNLQDVQVGENGLSVISTELASIESNLKKLGDDASAEYSVEIEEVRSSTTSLEASVAAASTNPSAASLAAVAEGVKAVGSAVSDLGDAAADTC